MSSPWKNLALFLSGLLLGGAVVGFGLNYYMKHRVDDRSNPDRILNHLSSALSLSDDQKTKVAALLKADAPKMEALRLEFEAKSHSLWMTFDKDLRPILEEGQNQKLDAMEKRWRGQHKGWNSGMDGLAPSKDSVPAPGAK